jgi:hypothetical protein
MYLPPSNIDELLNAPDYILPVLRGRQIAKLIGQGMSTSAEIYKAQETIAALEQELRNEAQHYDDNLILVFNIGHTAGYNHNAGWKEAVAGNREYGFKLGYVEAAKDHISGNNFILIDKKDLAKPIKAKSTNALIRKISLDNLCYDGLCNNTLQDKQNGGLIDIYVINSSWISAGDDILFLDITKTRKYAQEHGRITGKKIFRNPAGQLLVFGFQRS